MALLSNALVTLAEAKDYLEVVNTDSSQDSKVERLINTASARVEQWTARKLRYQQYEHIDDGTRTDVMLLPEYPVWSIVSVKVSSTNTGFANATEFDSDKYRIEDGGSLRLFDGLIFPRGRQNVQIIFNAGYEMQDQTGTEADPLPEDLKHGCLMLIDYIDQLQLDRRVGVVSKSRNGQSISFTEGMPSHIAEFLSPYQRVDLPHFTTQPGNV